MRTSKIISGALAALMVASTLVVGGVSASAASLKRPTNLTQANTQHCIRITWKKVKGAKKYKVYRGKKVIHTVTDTKCYDKKAKAGKTYKYCVQAVKGKTKSKKSKTITATRLTQPKGASVKATFNSLKFTWKSIKGATKYEIFRKTQNDTKYTKITTVKSTTFNDTTVKSDETYYYRARGVKGDSVSKGSDEVSERFVYGIGPFKMVIPKGSNEGTLTWDAVPEATGYEVYDWNDKLVDTVKTTSYKFTFDQKNISMLSVALVPVKGTEKAPKTKISFPYVPKGSYFTDKDGNVHAKVELKVGETYKDGATAAMFVNEAYKSATYNVEQPDNKDVVELASNLEIKALKAGTAQLKVTFDNTIASLLNTYLRLVDANDNYVYQNELKTGVAFVDVTVVE